MIKFLFIGMLVADFSVVMVQAQALGRDSVIKTAYADAQKFRLDKQDLKKFRKDRRNSNSDYFKPAKASVSDTTLLKDSLYVQAYREVAYRKTHRRRTAWHYAWVSVAVYDGIYAALLFGVILTGHAANLR